MKSLIIIGSLLLLVGMSNAENYNPATKEEALNFFNDILGQYNYTNDYGDPIPESPKTFNCIAISTVLVQFLHENGYDAYIFISDENKEKKDPGHAVVAVNLTTGWVVVEGISAPLQELGTMSREVDPLNSDQWHKMYGGYGNISWKNYIQKSDTTVFLS